MLSSDQGVPVWMIVQQMTPFLHLTLSCELPSRHPWGSREVIKAQMPDPVAVDKSLRILWGLATLAS